MSNAEATSVRTSAAMPPVFLAETSVGDEEATRERLKQMARRATEFDFDEAARRTAALEEVADVELGFARLGDALTTAEVRRRLKDLRR